jgi:hypothetical protein
MKKIETKNLNEVYKLAIDNHGSVEKDEQGQYILRTNMFMWADGSVRDEPEPSKRMK